MKLKNFKIGILITTFGITPYLNWANNESKIEEYSSIGTNDTIKNIKNKSINNLKEIKQYKQYLNNNLVENFYSQRLQQILHKNFNISQYGYNFFRTIFPKNIGISIIPDNYVLGVGDILNIYLINLPPDSDLPATLKVVIDSEGQITIPPIGSFPVAGLTIKEAEQILSQALGVKVKITLNRLRKFIVYVTGEVNKPGPTTVTGINTILDALAFAGGVKKDGSLREVILTRKIGSRLKTYKIDLYDILIKGKPIDITLREGDVILVKPIGKTAAIVGDVKRPAIYEIKNGTTLRDLLYYAGGLMPSAYTHKVVIFRYVKGENEKVLETSLENSKVLDTPIKDGDIIQIVRIKSIPKNVVYLSGYVRYPGVYEYKPGLTLKDLINEENLLKDTNLEFAEVERYNPQTLQREKIISFKPIEVLEGRYNLRLQPLDRIVLYPKYFFKPIKVSGFVDKPQWVPFKPGITLADVLGSVNFKEDPKRLKAEIIDPSGRKVGIIYLGKVLFKRNPKVNIQLKPGTEVVVKPISPNEIVFKVTVAGMVKRPGVYKIDENTTLYDVLKAAGGFRPGAYTKGLVLLRQSIAELQKEKLQKVIVLLKSTLEKEEASIMQADLTQEQLRAYRYSFEAQRKLLEEMKKTQITGRLAGLNVPSNLEALKFSSSNIVLEDGDKIYVPKVPSSVFVFGEVQNPGALLYHPGYTVKDYIALSGGFTKYADVENIFVIKANGIAISSETSDKLISWDNEHKRFVWGNPENKIFSYRLEPGDAIIVPVKIKVPIMWRPLIKDVVQIIYQSALTVYTITNL